MVDEKVLSNGVDIVKVKRIKKILGSTHKELFLKKIFNKEEILYFEHNNYNPKSVSGYFAAKEAIMKTLGKGMDKLSFRDITILKTRDNKPYIKLSGKAEDYMGTLGLKDFKISISHEDEYAVAFVIAV